MNRKSSPIIPRHRCQYLSKTFLWHLPPRQSSEAAPANSVPVPENETSVRLRSSREGLNPASIFLSYWKWVRYGCQSNVRWDDQIAGKVNWRLCKCRGAVQTTGSPRLISWRNDFLLRAFGGRTCYIVTLKMMWPFCHFRSGDL